jgi:hypothetical protein
MLNCWWYEFYANFMFAPLFANCLSRWRMNFFACYCKIIDSFNRFILIRHFKKERPWSLLSIINNCYYGNILQTCWSLYFLYEVFFFFLSFLTQHTTIIKWNNSEWRWWIKKKVPCLIIHTKSPTFSWNIRNQMKCVCIKVFFLSLLLLHVFCGFHVIIFLHHNNLT